MRTALIKLIIIIKSIITKSNITLETQICKSQKGPSFTHICDFNLYALAFQNQLHNFVRGKIELMRATTQPQYKQRCITNAERVKNKC